MGSIPKSVAMVSLCVVLASSCSKASNLGPTTTAGASAGAVTNPRAAGPRSSGGSTTGSHASGGPSPTSLAQTRGGGEAVQPSQNAPIDSGSDGQNSYFYLNRVVPKLTIEIDAVDGMAPQPSTISLIQTRSRSVADKPGGIDVLPA